MLNCNNKHVIFEKSIVEYNRKNRMQDHSIFLIKNFIMGKDFIII